LSSSEEGASWTMSGNETRPHLLPGLRGKSFVSCSI
jgi:hypothetical protein